MELKFSVNKMQTSIQRKRIMHHKKLRNACVSSFFLNVHVNTELACNDNVKKICNIG